MPDIHEGYGFPVGTVAATDAREGVVSPGGVGYDINCGVRLLALGVGRAELGAAVGPLMDEIARSVPTGTGRGGAVALGREELERVLARGSPAVVRDLGLGDERDLAHTESGGRLDGADPAAVSERARTRGAGQLGSLGAGNHFLELQVVERVLDPAGAAAMGLREGEVTALIHSGSRGLGHQVCTDAVRRMEPLIAGWGIRLPDRQLACAPAGSPEGREYLAAMACAANFAWSNRQVLAHRVREAVRRVLGDAAAAGVRQVYDVAHNIAKPEEHGGRRVLVHRKGATRAFGPGRAGELPEDFAAIGQPVFVPGSMGTGSWVLRGLDGGEERSLASACHGAGRLMSRGAARRRIGGRELRRELEAAGIAVRCASAKGLAEEAPFAYKDVDRVVAVVERAGIAARVARLRPIGVLKG
ncbi:RtcB family protein [Miltoncostaea marina]|uniref:RtcB family protein n=1 Tax=Miltoncostaea marina TaxID=2843215 RepID=UPI001FE3E50C|nr:RtcB family protein [Miltoncostaea marina]